MPTTLHIDHRFCGPPTSGNGGYVCGMLDNFTDYVSEVTLRRPPPLDRELTLEHNGDEFRLLDGNELIALARPGKLDFSPPAPPSFEAAREASRHYIGYEGHPFATCFVCGPEREPGDGLRIFAGQMSGEERVAAPWTPDASLAGDDGLVRNEFVWAALDCPGYFAIVGNHLRPVLLGRMTAEVRREIKARAPHIVIGWPLGQEGKKLFCGTAVYNEHQELCAVAQSVWVDISQK